MEIRLDRDDLKEHELDPLLKVSGEWKEMAAEDILAAVLSQANLDYIVEEGRLRVVSRGSGTEVTLIYAVERLCPDAASLKQLEKAISKVGDEDEWESFSGFASVAVDATQRKLTVTHWGLRQTEIRNVIRKFGEKQK